MPACSFIIVFYGISKWVNEWHKHNGHKYGGKRNNSPWNWLTMWIDEIDIWVRKLRGNWLSKRNCSPLAWEMFIVNGMPRNNSKWQKRRNIEDWMSIVLHTHEQSGWRKEKKNSELYVGLYAINRHTTEACWRKWRHTIINEVFFKSKIQCCLVNAFNCWLLTVSP